MTNSIANTVLRRIRAKKRGWVFSPKDFLDLGNRSNIDFILHQLVKKDVIRRISRGIYDYPVKHPKLGDLFPATDNILKAIAARTGEIIQPCGAEAANWLGLSTQVPVQPPYLTNGRSRIVNIANKKIRLKHTHINPLRKQVDKTNLVVQALIYLGKQGIDDRILQMCNQQLSIKEKKDLKHMALQVPSWLTPIIHKIAV